MGYHALVFSVTQQYCASWEEKKEKSAKGWRASKEVGSEDSRCRIIKDGEKIGNTNPSETTNNKVRINGIESRKTTKVEKQRPDRKFGKVL